MKYNSYCLKHNIRRSMLNMTISMVSMFMRAKAGRVCI